MSSASFSISGSTILDKFIEINNPDYLYRYENQFIDGHYSSIYLTRYKIIKRTPKGVWLKIGIALDSKKFVNQTSKSQWAWPTELQAREHFFYRKRKEALIALHRVSNAFAILQYIEREFKLPDSTDMELCNNKNITFESHNIDKLKNRFSPKYEGTPDINLKSILAWLDNSLVKNKFKG